MDPVTASTTPPVIHGTLPALPAVRRRRNCRYASVDHCTAAVAGRTAAGDLPHFQPGTGRPTRGEGAGRRHPLRWRSTGAVTAHLCLLIFGKRRWRRRLGGRSVAGNGVSRVEAISGTHGRVTKATNRSPYRRCARSPSSAPRHTRTNSTAVMTLSASQPATKASMRAMDGDGGPRRGAAQALARVIFLVACAVVCQVLS